MDYLIIAVIGILAGGVVNILADDLPLRRSIRLPRYVPDTKKAWIHLLHDENEIDIAQQDDERRPVLAWLGITAFVFGKRTSSDGSVTLNWRYPLTELLTAGLMILTLYAYNTGNHLQSMGMAQLAIWLVYMVIFSLITIIDIEHKLILFIVIIPSALFALFDATLTTIIGEGFRSPEVTNALIGGALGFGVFFLMYNGGFLFTYIMGKLRGQEIDEIAFGYGDVMMATVSGLILGWRALIFAMFITVFLGAFGALLYLISRRLIGSKYSAFTAIPYGPYIVIGTIIILLYREPVIDFLVGR